MAHALSGVPPFTVAVSVLGCLVILLIVARAWVVTKRLERFGWLLVALSLFVSLMQSFPDPILPQAESVDDFMYCVGFVMIILSYRQAEKRPS